MVKIIPKNYPCFVPSFSLGAAMLSVATRSISLATVDPGESKDFNEARRGK